MSADANGNGFADEREVGEPFDGEYTGTDDDAVWEAFYEWHVDQTWGPSGDLTGAEQFAQLVAKLRELGLPLENPW